MFTEQQLAVLGGMIVGIFAVVVIYYIIRVIAYWKIFTKAGEKGWKSIIPFYNVIVQYQFTWTALMGVIYLALYIVGDIIMQRDGIMGTIGSLMVIAGFVINCMDMHKLSKSFGHGGGFTVGLILLQPIFLMILGFGSSEYQGNASEM